MLRLRRNKRRMAPSTAVEKLTNDDGRSTPGFPPKPRRSAIQPPRKAPAIPTTMLARTPISASRPAIRLANQPASPPKRIHRGTGHSALHIESKESRLGLEWSVMKRGEVGSH